MNVHDGRRCPTTDAHELIRLRDEVLATAPIENVPVAALLVADSPRLAGEDGAYVRALAEVEASLPPLIVHRGTMRVIDGVHRLRAAVSNGHTTVAARYFDGSAEEATLLSVGLNISHGRPLTLDDRVAAVLRIFSSHPHWSDRAVATLAGLSAAKVAGLRRASGAAEPSVRIGRDGRARPVDASAGRERARRLLEEDPGASMRQIAREAGISAATAADVRDRMRQGESATATHRTSQARSQSAASATVSRLTTRSTAQPPKTPEQLLRAVESLKRDPSLRHNQTGRALLRMLTVCAAIARDPEHVATALPSHRTPQLAELLHEYAQVCEHVAGRLRASQHRVS